MTDVVFATTSIVGVGRDDVYPVGCHSNEYMRCIDQAARMAMTGQFHFVPCRKEPATVADLCGTNFIFWPAQATEYTPAGVRPIDGILPIGMPGEDWLAARVPLWKQYELGGVMTLPARGDVQTIADLHGVGNVADRYCEGGCLR